MSWLRKRLMGIGVLICIAALWSCVTINPGGDGNDPSITLTIANQTFTLTLGTVGRFTVEPGILTSNIADVNGVLFARTPTDQPVSGALRLRSSTIEVVAPGGGKVAVTQQAISGSATVNVFIAEGGTANPCETGIEVGTFTITVNSGTVTSADQDLVLPPAALALILTNNFSLCLRIEADFSAIITIPDIDFVFGPDGGDVDNGNDNGGNDNAGNDNTDNANDNDGNTNGNTNDNADNSNDNVPADYTVAEIIHRGSEQIVAGPNVDPAQSLQTPAGYGVNDIALSGDGQRVWFVLFDQFPAVGDPTTQLWSVNTDGTGGLRSDLSTADLRDTVLAVATNEDGSIAIADSGFNSSAVLRATPGAAATLLFDTAVLGLGGCLRGDTRLTDDGSSFFYRSYCTQSLFQAGTGSGSAPTELFQAGQFTDPNGFAARAIQDFDIDSIGSRWILDMEVLNSTQNNTLYFYALPGTGGVAGTAETLPFDTRDFRNLQFNDDGSQFAYCQGGPTLADLFVCHVQPSGASARTTVTDNRTNLGDLGFPDNTSRVYVRTSVESSGECSFFQILATGERYAGGSSRFADAPCAAFTSPQLSEDGTLLASATSKGVYVLHDGTDGLLGFPIIENIHYRYEGDPLLNVRVVLAPGTAVERIYVLPYYNTGLDPTTTVPEDENPFFNDRSGGGVNLSTTFTPVEGLSDVWERDLNLCNGLGVCKRSFITDDYRLRIVVVDPTGTRTTFHDFIPLP